MKSMFTPRELPPIPKPCEECMRLEEAWRADEDRILADGRVIARLTGLLRRLRATPSSHPTYAKLVEDVDNALESLC
jgi:hypothetical protein